MNDWLIATTVQTNPYESHVFFLFLNKVLLNSVKSQDGNSSEVKTAASNHFTFWKKAPADRHEIIY